MPVSQRLHGAELRVHTPAKFQASLAPDLPALFHHSDGLLNFGCPGTGSHYGHHVLEEKEETNGEKGIE